MNGQLPMLATFFFELLGQTSSVGNNDGLVAVLNEVLAEFEGAALDASGVEFRKDLEYFHKDRMSCFGRGSIFVFV